MDRMIKKSRKYQKSNRQAKIYVERSVTAHLLSYDSLTVHELHNRNFSFCLEAGAFCAGSTPKIANKNTRKELCQVS